MTCNLWLLTAVLATLLEYWLRNLFWNSEFSNIRFPNSQPLKHKCNIMYVIRHKYNFFQNNYIGKRMSLQAVQVRVFPLCLCIVLLLSQELVLVNLLIIILQLPWKLMCKFTIMHYKAILPKLRNSSFYLFEHVNFPGMFLQNHFLW